MYQRLLLYPILAFFCVGEIFAQTVSIQSNNEVCLNELLVLQSNVTGSATAYAWDFGDNSSSTQENTIHPYSQIGSKTVKLTVTFSDGSTVTASKSIMVHDLPTADFELDNSDLCFYDHEICIKDNSTMGQTTNGYSSRLILWGDGNQNANTNPSKGDVICYDQYPKVSPYTLDIEVVNDKGCEDKWEYTFSLLEDYKASFTYNKQTAECDEQVVCFTNDSASAPANIESWEWSYGDGTTEKGSWSTNCHAYTAVGTYTVKLTVTLKNGCTNTYTQQVNINFPIVKADVKYGDTVKCFPSPFYFTNPAVRGAEYYWLVYDRDTSPVMIAGRHREVNIFPPSPNDYYVQFVVRLDDCADTSRLIKISSVGVKANFLALNRKQCSLEDTVFFANFSLAHPDADPQYQWYFDDQNAPDCIGFPTNCNEDTAFNTQHWYSDTGCYFPKLVVTDPVSGCVDSMKGLISLLNIDELVFQANMDRPCLGNKTEYGVNFTYEACELVVSVCLDSLANDQHFESVGGTHFYAQTAHDSGWVTVGFAIEAGDQRIYKSADSNDYYLDPTRVCFDTQWYHHWYQLFHEPIANFTLDKEGQCLPINATLKYNGDEDDKIDYLKYVWDPQLPIELQQVHPDTVPDLKHTYTEEGSYDIFILIQDTNGCYNYKYFQERFGYHNTFLTDTLICLGDTSLFSDSIRYYDDPQAYWERTGRAERLWWDFGDGGGFSSTQSHPSHVYQSKGKFNVRLASVDVNGCVDTVAMDVVVTGVNADIFNKEGQYLCDQIVQFFDSSYFDIDSTSDKIEHYFWDFGDYKTPSYLKDPYHYFSSNGAFTITHAVRSTAGCVDTATFDIFLNGPIPYFDIISDTVGCEPYTAEFKSTSTNFSSLIWHMGDSANTTIYASSDSVVRFKYSNPGIYNIYLEGSDSFYNEDTKNSYTCSALFPDTNAIFYPVRRIIVLPIPEVDFKFSGPACVGQPVIFESLSDSIYDIFNWIVESKDTTVLTNSYSHVFSDTGTYSVQFNPYYVPEGPYERACFDDTTYQVTVTSLNADFSFVQNGSCSEYAFTDSSTNAVSYQWDFGHPRSGNDNFSDLQNPTHAYKKDTGTFEVCLVAANDSGCLDTACNEVVGTYYEALDLYNIFTPNGDLYNEEFILEIVNQRYFNLKIFNRWGEQVFQTDDPAIGWNGRTMNVGEELPASTYFYVLQYGYACDGLDHLVEGQVELVR